MSQFFNQSENTTEFFRNKIFDNILVYFTAERAKRRKTWSGSPSKVPDPVLDANDLEVDRTMGSMEYLAPPSPQAGKHVHIGSLKTGKHVPLELLQTRNLVRVHMGHLT